MTPGGRFEALADKGRGNIVKKEASLFFSYEDGKLNQYTEDPFLIFPNDKGEIDFSVFNWNYQTDDPRMYLSFDPRNVDPTKPTLLISKDIIGSINNNGPGPVINLGSGNRFGVGINKEGGNDLAQGVKTVSFQANLGYAILNRGDPGKLARLQLKGSSVYGPDKVTFFGDIKTGNYYYKPSAQIEQVNHGDGTAALQINFINQKGEEMNFDFFANNENQFIEVTKGQLKGTADLQFFGDKEGRFYSPNVAFNLLSPEKQKFLSTLTQNELNELKIEIIDKAGVAGLEAQLQKIQEGRRSPLRASVKTIGDTGSGCSGTLVGFIGDKAYVLTAAHCGRGTRNIYLNNLNEEGEETKIRERRTRIRGKVVARSTSTRSGTT